MNSTPPTCTSRATRRNIRAPRVDPALLAAIRELLPDDQHTQDDQVRLRHGHGHTQEEMYSIKYGAPGRVPDLVVYPDSDEQVEALVQAAIQHDACLIPYGGGTNVTDALRCNEEEPRTVVSVDMSRMGRVLWIDPTNRMALHPGRRRGPPHHRAARRAPRIHHGA